MPEHSPEMIALAEKAVVKWIGDKVYVDGELLTDRITSAMQHAIRNAVIAAIAECTERAAKLAQRQANQWRVDGYYNRQFAAGTLATALRNQEHLQ